MKLGLIADVHGNLHALGAVLGVLREAGAEQIICAGDLVAYGAYPNEVIALLRREAIPSVLGNYDHAAAWGLESASAKPSSPRNEPLKRAALAWTQQQLTSENRHYLRGLPWLMRYKAGGGVLSALHAGLDALDEWHTPQTPESLWRLSLRLEPGVVVLGHTHLPFEHRAGSTFFINPGAVGRSLDGDPRAACALLDTASGEARFMRVAYDLEAAIAAIAHSGMPTEIAALVGRGLRRIEDLPEEVA